ncbi:MAG: UDP-N-acetylmuramoyl-L-alanyl-D-glutamate--2,6-diaminopimelate ligase, partial [Deltaproteobacteria bacterium]|nr:UDP-N-acetylmuramoyl-L-alanyl-D-glutamate--2,6-diaminopimelate ligase [Deltaproteobacteria bacterium]
MNAVPNTISLEALSALAREGKARVSSHSGAVAPGDIFVALPKAAPVGPDGPDYSAAAGFLTDALRAGAAYAVCTQGVFTAVTDSLAALGTGAKASFAVALVDDPREALGVLAKARYGTDDRAVSLLGITGTNGKTTSTYLLEALFRAAGRVPGVIGTVAYRWPGHEEASPLTTPDCMSLHGMLAAMREAGADTALMEVSSHAIEQNRIAGLSFAGALFTNLTQDHLDYHRDMETYFEVKSRLFLNARQGAALAVNMDDPYGQRLFDKTPAALGYGFARHERRKGRRVLNGLVLEQSREGLRLRMDFAGEPWELHSPLVGEFNAANLLGVQALALAFGLVPRDFRVLETFNGVPGRLERVPNNRGLAVFVDYAHTPDALQKALLALRGARFERIITVFGCGGNRDRAKRP